MSYSVSPSATQVERSNLDFARLYMAGSDLKKALEHAQRSLASNSGSLGALTLSGEIKEAQGDDIGALAAYQSALAVFRQQHPRAYEQPLPLLNAIKRLTEKQGCKPIDPDNTAEGRDYNRRVEFARIGQ